MEIPVSVLKELGINHDGENKKGFRFPRPFLNYGNNIDVSKGVSKIIDLNVLKKQTKSKTYILNNLSSSKCEKTHLFDLEAYDVVSIKNGSFLLSNIDRVNVFYGHSDVDLFDRMFIYDECNHTLKLKVVGRGIDCIEFHEKVFEKSVFIPLIFINRLSTLDPVTTSMAYLDIIRDKQLSLKLAAYRSRVDYKLACNKFYFVRKSNTYGTHLVKDTKKEKIAMVYSVVKERDLIGATVCWKDIKDDYAIRSGLNTFLNTSNLDLKDESKFILRVNYNYNMLWLTPVES